MLSRLIQESETQRFMDNTYITEIRQLPPLNHYPCFDVTKMSITIKEAVKKKRDKSTSLSLANLTVLMM